MLQCPSFLLSAFPKLETSKRKLADDFDIKDLGVFKYILVLEFATSKEGKFVSQCPYVHDLLTETSLLGRKSVETSVDLEVTVRQYIRCGGCDT